jgi:hypothetical protein
LKGITFQLQKSVLLLFELKDQLQSRLDHSFIPITVDSLLTRLENSNPGIKEKFLLEVQNFYANNLGYRKEWTKHPNDFKNLQWTLHNSNFEWEEVQNALLFLQEQFHVHVHDNALFDEVRMTKNYLTPGKILHWSENKVEVGQKWLETFRGSL